MSPPWLSLLFILSLYPYPSPCPIAGAPTIPCLVRASPHMCVIQPGKTGHPAPRYAGLFYCSTLLYASHPSPVQRVLFIIVMLFCPLPPAPGPPTRASRMWADLVRPPGPPCSPPCFPLHFHTFQDPVIQIRPHIHTTLHL